MCEEIVMEERIKTIADELLSNHCRLDPKSDLTLDLGLSSFDIFLLLSVLEHQTKKSLDSMLLSKDRSVGCLLKMIDNIDSE